MKWLIILALAFILLQADGKNNGKRYGPEETCTTELHLSRRKMKAVINDDNTPENHRTYGKFMLCVFKKRGITNENGVINENGLLEFLQLVFFDHHDATESQKMTVEYVFEKCKDIRSHNPEKSAVKLKNCIAKYRKLSFREDIHNLNLRYKGGITPPLHRTSLFEGSFTYSIYRLYTAVPVHIRNYSLNKFKLHYREYLLKSKFQVS